MSGNKNDESSPRRLLEYWKQIIKYSNYLFYPTASQHKLSKMCTELNLLVL